MLQELKKYPFNSTIKNHSLQTPKSWESRLIKCVCVCTAASFWLRQLFYLSVKYAVSFTWIKSFHPHYTISGFNISATTSVTSLHKIRIRHIYYAYRTLLLPPAPDKGIIYICYCCNTQREPLYFKIMN